MCVCVSLTFSFPKALLKRTDRSLPAYAGVSMWLLPSICQGVGKKHLLKNMPVGLTTAQHCQSRSDLTYGAMALAHVCVCVQKCRCGYICNLWATYCLCALQLCISEESVSICMSSVCACIKVCRHVFEHVCLRACVCVCVFIVSGFALRFPLALSSLIKANICHTFNI